MSSRDNILGAVRSSLEGMIPQNLAEKRMDAAQRRIAQHPRGVIPDRLSKPKRSSTSLFCNKVLEAEGSVQQVKSYSKIGPVVAKYLRQHNIPTQIRIGNDPRLQGIRWGKGGLPEVQTGASDGSDLVCVSHAIGAVSETGTLILTSGRGNPSTLNFLPETHIVVVNRKNIRKSYEGMWKTIRRKFGKGNMPRTVNMITGPSRSADIEQTLILGAHGPLRLHVIVVDEGI